MEETQGKINAAKDKVSTQEANKEISKEEAAAKLDKIKTAEDKLQLMKDNVDKQKQELDKLEKLTNEVK